MKKDNTPEYYETVIWESVGHFNSVSKNVILATEDICHSNETIIQGGFIQS